MGLGTYLGPRPIFISKLKMALSRTVGLLPAPKKKPQPTRHEEEVAVKKAKKRIVVEAQVEEPALAKPKLALSRAQEPRSAEDAEGEDDDGQAIVRMLPGVKKSQLRRLQSMFGQRSDDIIDLLEIDNSDGALSLVSKTMMQTLVDVLPVIERNVRRSRGARGVYQLNQVISQIREMCHDIQSFKDKAQIGTTIVERQLRPSYLDIAVQISASFTELENGARSRMSKEDFEVYRMDFIQLMKNNLGSFLKQQYDVLSEKIVKSVG
jgi:hypothetical protein